MMTREKMHINNMRLNWMSIINGIKYCCPTCGAISSVIFNRDDRQNENTGMPSTSFGYERSGQWYYFEGLCQNCGDEKLKEQYNSEQLMRDQELAQMFFLTNEPYNAAMNKLMRAATLRLDIDLGEQGEEWFRNLVPESFVQYIDSNKGTTPQREIDKKRRCFNNDLEKAVMQKAKELLLKHGELQSAQINYSMEMFDILDEIGCLLPLCSSEQLQYIDEVRLRSASHDGFRHRTVSFDTPNLSVYIIREVPRQDIEAVHEKSLRLVNKKLKLDREEIRRWIKHRFKEAFNVAENP